MRLMKSILRASVLLSSLALLIGCVWFAQKQANPVVMPGSKSGTLIIPTQQSPSKTIMPGSKSFTGATTVSGGTLQVQTSKPAAKP
jgi:autotransporter-associated beta strand protein